MGRLSLFFVLFFLCLSVYSDVDSPDRSASDDGASSASTSEGNVSELTTSDVGGELQRQLSDISSMKANFLQTTFDTNDQIVQKSEGRLWLGGNAKFRIETNIPFEQTLVSDGRSFWTYDIDLQQVVIKPLETDIQKVPILLFGNQNQELLSNYRVSVIEYEKTVGYILDPITVDSMFETMTLEFAGKLPVQISILDALGQRTHIKFADLSINQVAPKQTFHLVPPAGIDVIDDR